MFAKLILIYIIYLISKKEFLDYIIRKTISITRREGNESIGVKITTFFSKSFLVSK